MLLDIADLRDFYTTPTGQMARRILSAKIRARWPRVTGETLIGLGFASPFLGSYRKDAARVGALMPETQGALIWPRNGPVLATLVDERQLPLPDNSVDRLLVTHCLEVTDHAPQVLREIWRVLKPQGKLMIIVPNRRGIWAHIENTPFGQGLPFSRSQLETLLRQSLLTPTDSETLLHAPPLNRTFIHKGAHAIERIGARVMPALGGVLLMEARKDMMAPLSGKLVRARAIGDLVTVR